MVISRSARFAVVVSFLALGAVTVASPRVEAAEPTSGAFSALTYNVAGLPDFLSSGNPARNTPEIGARIRGYDIVNVQEDFNYHAALYAADDHQFRSATSGGAGIGSGLNTLSRFPLADFGRVKWSACNGTDCLTPKGFTWSRIRLAEGVYVDLYNAHTNAGTAEADLAARRANITQLADYIAATSAGHAVIVMGDLNARYTRAGDNIRQLRERLGLTDAWVQLVRGGSEPALGTPGLVCDPANVTNSCEVVDKIFYRGNGLIQLTATEYQNEHPRFVDSAGAMLSDHYPHLVRFGWQLHAGLRTSDLFGGPHGHPFTDLDPVSAASPRRFTMRAGSRLDQIGVELANGVSLTHGGNGGSPRSLTLAPGEYVTQLRLSAGKKDGHTRIFFAELRTNHGTVLSGGSQTANSVTYTAPDGWQIAGFHGRSGNEVDKLGAVFTPLR